MNLFANAFYNLNQILNYSFLNNSVKSYLIAIGIFVLLVIALKIFEKAIIARIKKLAQKTKTEFDDLLINIIQSVGWPFYFFVSLELALQFINLAQLAEKTVFYIFLIVVVYYAAKGTGKVIDFVITKAIKKTEEDDHIGFDPSAVRLLGQIIKGVIWGIAIIIVLQNFGYNVTSLVVGFGIGGVAIAFAFQNILEDIFSSFSIYFDKPFKTGDFIIVGEHMGTVKNIGIKSTRVQALQGEEIVISNRELVSARVQNFKKLEKRRIVFGFGLTYDTPAEKLKRAKEIVEEIIDKEELTDLDRVHFKEFGDFSLNFEVVYYINSSDYLDYMNTQENINLAIKKAFEKEKIEMAFPTQTIYLNK